jgi:hypothetical protein
MSSRKASVILLFEDSRHSRIIRDWLKKRGIDDRRLRKRDGRNNAGVIAAFAEELSSLEKHQQHRLIVVIDGDDQAFDERVRELFRRTERNSAQTRQQFRQRLAIIVPSYHIESWIHFAKCGEVVERTGDQQQDAIRRQRLKQSYPGRDTSECPAVAEKLEEYYQLLRQQKQPPAGVCPSLWCAAAELASLDFEQQ